MEPQRMANVRDIDTSLWLHNKLGSNEAWTSGSISSQLNPEVLRNIKDCFIDLQTQVKLKLLLSFFHIPRRNIEEWRIELQDILEVAQGDSEQWVSMLAEIMKPYAANATLNLDVTEPDENRRIFVDLVDEITKELKRGKDLNVLPMECHYLNKNALMTIVGQLKQPTKHFTLKKKPKSADLRAELLLKASEQQTSSAERKIPAPTIPLRTRGMPRKMTDTTPLKGIPSQLQTRTPITPALASRTLSRTPAGKKEGGVKLLEITEQPVGYALAKRRKKLQDMEESKKSLSQEEAQSTPETPDYAAGLATATRVASPPPPTPLLPPPTPSPYQPPTPQPLSAPPTPMVPSYTRLNSIPDGPPPTPTPITPEQTSQFQASLNSFMRQQAQRLPQPVLSPVQTMTKTVILQVPTHQPTQIVTLSKELMEKAQEIFRTANKATRPEKEHILKFMAGTRENPCPELGSIVTIKLSEHEEKVRQKDGGTVPLSVETHFQMNYLTGEWKVIQKPPKPENSNSPNPNSQHQPQQQQQILQTATSAI